MRLLATIIGLLLSTAVFVALLGTNLAALGVLLTVAIGSMALATLVLWIGRRTEDPETRLVRNVEIDAARRLRLGQVLEARETIEPHERGRAIVEAGDERTVRLLIELIRLGDRVICRDAIEELAAVGPDARPWIEGAMSQVGGDAKIDLRLALEAIDERLEEDQALPVVRVFE